MIVKFVYIYCLQGSNELHQRMWKFDEFGICYNAHSNSLHAQILHVSFIQNISTICHRMQLPLSCGESCKLFIIKIQLDSDSVTFSIQFPGRDAEKVSRYHQKSRNDSVKSEICIIWSRSEGGGHNHGENITENNQV